MNALVERKVIALLNNIQALANSAKPPAEREEEALGWLDEINQLLTPRLHSIADDFALETLIRVPEAALQYPKRIKMAEKYFKLFFRNVESEGLFHIKAHVLYAQLLSQRAGALGVSGQAKIQLIQDALHHITKAVAAIISDRSRKRYAFMVYNISKALYQMIRVYFRPGQLREFAEVVQLVSQSLATQLDDEYDWKGFFSWLLFYCLEDTKTGKVESVQILEKLWENSKQSPYFFHEALFRLRVFNSATSSAVWQTISKEAEKDATGELKVIFALQSIKTRIIPENQFEKELTALMRLLLPSKNEELQKPMTNSTVDLLTELAHTAAQHGILSVAEKVIDFLKKKQQVSSKAFVLMEFAKAEMLIRLKTDYSNANKDQQSFAQSREIDIEKRREALHVITKAVKVRMGFINPMFVYEGCVKIWNFSLPFLNEKRKNDVLKPFQTATRVLEEIQSSDFHLRLRLHYEVARIHLENGDVTAAEEHSRKCQVLLSFCEDAFDPKKVETLIDKVNELLHPVDSDSRSLLDVVCDRLQSIQNRQDDGVTAEMAIIQRDLAEFNLESLDFLGSDLASRQSCLTQQIEIDKLDEKHRLVAQKTLLKNIFYKLMIRKCAVYEEACRIAFEKNQVDICLQLASDFIFMVEKFAESGTQPAPVDPTPEVTPADLYFDVNADQDIQINMVKILFTKAQAYIKKMTDEEVEFALEDMVRLNRSNEPLKYSAEEYAQMKTEIVTCFTKGAELALRLQQTWLIFNAGIIIWNAYLPVFKSVMNSHKLHPMTIKLLEFYFEALKQAVHLIEKRKIVDYDLENKVQVYGNISIIYTRLLEQKGDYAKIYSVTEELLLVSLTPQTRKIVNSIRARVGLMLKPEAKGKKQMASLTNQTDQTVFEINSKLEVIANHFNGTQKHEERWQAIRECFDLLLDFHQKQKDQLDAELLCELWTKLANLSLNEEKIECTKLALASLELALEKSGAKELTSLAKSKYTALAKFLYAKALCHFVETSGIEKEQHEMVLLKSLQMILESIDLSIKIKNPKFFEQIKKFYLIIRTIVEQFYTAENRRCIIQPIFTLIYYVKIAKDTFDNFMRELELSQILVNLTIYVTRGCLDKDDWEMTFMTCNLLLEICLPSLKDRVAILRIIAMTKKETDIEKVFEEVKDCSAVLQCTLLQEIAWNAESVQVQYKAFTRAIDIVKKENSGKIFEVILNFKEWMFRNDFPVDNIKKSLKFLERLIHKKCTGQGSGTYLAFVPSEQEVRKKRYSSFTGEVTDQNLSEVTSLVNLNPESTEEVCRYFGSSHASFQNSQRLFGSVAYSAEDCDSLFKVYYISSLIVQDLREKMTYISSAVFFVWKTWQLIFEQLNSFEPALARGEDPEFTQAASSGQLQMPTDWQGWLDLELPAAFLTAFPKLTGKDKFCRDAYKQPLITFHYLATIMETPFEYCSFEQAAFLIKFVQLFATMVMDNPVAAQLPTLWSAQLCHAAGKPERTKQFLAAFTKEVPMTQQYFVRETQEFSKCFSDAFSKNFELNPINSKAKKSHFLNIYYVFEFWVAFAEILFSIQEYPTAQVLIQNAIPCCITASAAELLGKCEVMLAAIHSLNGETSRAVGLLESAAKNVKLLKNWKSFILVSVGHFMDHGDVINPWKILDKFERLLEQISPKDCFQYNKLHGKDVTGVIQLLKAELNLEEFFLFERNAIAEKETFYCENLSNLLSENLGLFTAFLRHTQGGVSLRNFELLVRIFRKSLGLVDNLRVLNYEIINDAYIFVTLQLILFEKVIGCFAETFPALTAALAAHQKPVSLSENSSRSNVSIALVSPSDFLGYRFLCEMKLVRAQWINVCLDIEAIYRANNYSFPSVNEKYLEEKFFGVTKKLLLQQEFEQSPENVIDDYVDIYEYRLTQNIRRSWALIHSNQKTLQELLTVPHLAQSDRFLIQIELEKTNQFRFGYQKELSFTKANIVSNYELTIRNASMGVQSSQEVKPPDSSGLVAYPEEVLSFPTFGDFSYFRFNRLRCFRSLHQHHYSEDKQLLFDLTEYQDFQAKRAMTDFFLGAVAQDNSIVRSFRECLHTKDRTRLATLISKTPVLQRLLCQTKVEDSLRLLPRNSLYVILEPNPNYCELFCGAIFLAEEESQSVYKFIKLKNGSSMVSALKGFLQWYENVWDEVEDTRAHREEIQRLYKEKVTFLTQSFTELFGMLTEIIQKGLEIQAADPKSKARDPKKTGSDIPRQKLGGLYILTNQEMIEAPFPLIFEPLVDNFATTSVDLSISILGSKFQAAAPTKTVSVTRSDAFFISKYQIATDEFPEVKAIDGLAKQLCSDALDWDSKSAPDVCEVQKAYEKKRLMIFASCVELQSVWDASQELPLAGKSRLDLIMVLEKLKIDRPAFAKYNARFKMTSNYMRVKSQTLIAAIHATRMAIITNDIMTDKAATILLEGLNQRSDGTRTVGEIVAELQLAESVTIIGNPSIIISNDQKKR